MSIFDQNRIYDGYSNLAGGVDGGREANLIDKNQCSEANNVIFRGGAPTNRLPFRKHTLTFDNPNLTYHANGFFQSQDGPLPEGQTTFLEGTFQEASYYNLGPGKQYIMVSISGRYYRITPGLETSRVYEVALDKRNRNTIPINYHLQADRFHIVQDGEAIPIIFDGTDARRSGEDEIFTGTIMGTGMGRIVLVSNGLIYFGDIFDGMGGLGNDMLKFTETQFLNEGFPSALPSFMGKPTAVRFLPLQDTATGVGECLVWGENGCESFFLSIPREQWKDSAFQRTALISIGNGGHRSTAVINSDIWFRSHDGWRSYRQARAEVNQYAQVPLSTNVRKYVEADTRRWLTYASAISFDNRVLMSSTPYPNSDRLYHNGMLSIDFDVLSTFGTASGPGWDGHWSNRVNDPFVGLKLLQLVEGVFDGEHRAFAFVIDPSTLHNSLVEISKKPTGGDTAGAIVSNVTLRSMDFDSEFNEKKLYGGDIWITEVEEETEVSVSYRPDQLSYFTPWDDFTVEPIEGLTQGEAPVVTEGFTPRRALPKPEDLSDDENTERSLLRGFEFQTKIEWFGRAKMRKVRMQAQVETEQATANV